MASIVRIPQFQYSLFITHITHSLHRPLSQSFSLSLSLSPQSLSTRWHSISSAHRRISTSLIQSQLCQTSQCSRLPATTIAIARSFHTALPRQRDYHFDTLKLVHRLREEGFTEEQSVAMMKVLSDVIEERWELNGLPWSVAIAGSCGSHNPGIPSADGSRCLFILRGLWQGYTCPYQCFGRLMNILCC